MSKINRDLSLFNQSGLMDIQFANFGQSVVLEFCDDMGQLLGHLVCHDLLRFHFVDQNFKQGQYSEQLQGFAHYIHQIHMFKIKEHIHISLRPYVDLDIECRDFEILLPQHEHSVMVSE